MKNILITGGTIFVSKFIAQYYINKNNNVYVLNRNTHKQIENVNLIKADKNNIGQVLLKYKFDIVIAVNIYNQIEMKSLIDGLSYIDKFIFISSSAVYPENTTLPFKETSKVGHNAIWGAYGTNKISAEEYLLKKVPNAYIIRPPYLYGEMQNLYREAFIFDCAINKRNFCMPYNSSMKLQLFDVLDLCRFIDKLLEILPRDNIFNVGNTELIDIYMLVSMCYEVVGEKLNVIQVDNTHEQRDFFPFYNYEYYLDVTKQKSILKNTTSVEVGLKKSLEWYVNHPKEINKKPYFEYIELRLLKS